MRRPGPLFLAPKSYRRRRLRDAARLLPVFGAFLCLLPVLWAPEAGGAARSTGADGLYLFAVWAGLILVAAALARGLSGGLPGGLPGGPEPDGPPPADADEG